MATEAKTAQDLELERVELEAKKENESRSGVGTRVHVGKTRGKNPIVIKWEAFDESIAGTLPTSIQQFMDTVGVNKEPQIVEYLVEGYNAANYSAASDPLAEFLNPSWPDDAKAQFRLVVRNYSRGAQVSLEDAVGLIKPGFEKQFSAKQ